jgi:hypothetical protein
MSPWLLSKRAALVLIACPTLILGGCSDTFSTGPSSPPTFANSSKSYAHTLTPEQQKAVIADLKNEQARRQGPAADDATASINPGN